MTITKLLAAAFLLAALAPLPAQACTPEVEERAGAIVYHDCSSADRILSGEGSFSQPTLSPDDSQVAFIKIEHQGTESYGDSRTSLWVADVATGKARLLVASTPSEGMTETLEAMWEPQFSLDGGFVYVMAEAWVTSHAIHQVNVKTGMHKYVTDGELGPVIRSGKYRGYLVVQKHLYHGAPDYGSYNPVYIVRPSGKWSMLVPGSDKDDGETSLDIWLKKNVP